MFLIKKLSLIFVISLLLCLLYYGIAFTLVYFPQKEFNNEQKKLNIYVLYNKIHSDIVINIKDTNEAFQEKFQKIIKNKNGYLAIGWGDKESYIDTPVGEKLNKITILKALFTNTPSVLHVKYIQELNSYKNIKKIALSKKQLENIEKSIVQSLNLPDVQTYKGYYNNDLFYDSCYTYNVFQTCNTWTGDKLRDANISMSYWTPLRKNVIDSLP